MMLAMVSRSASLANRVTRFNAWCTRVNWLWVVHETSPVSLWLTWPYVHRPCHVRTFFCSTVGFCITPVHLQLLRPVELAQTLVVHVIGPPASATDASDA